MPIVAMNVASPSLRPVSGASIPQRNFGSDCNDESPPEFAPIFLCRGSNVGFFSQWIREASAPFQRAGMASIGKWAN
jgi:hypothetical protein